MSHCHIWWHRRVSLNISFSDSAIFNRRSARPRFSGRAWCFPGPLGSSTSSLWRSSQLWEWYPHGQRLQKTNWLWKITIFSMGKIPRFLYSHRFSSHRCRDHVTSLAQAHARGGRSPARVAHDLIRDHLSITKQNHPYSIGQYWEDIMEKSLKSWLVGNEYWKILEVIYLKIISMEHIWNCDSMDLIEGNICRKASC